MLLAYLYLALLEPKTPPKQLRRPCRELLPKRSRKEVERRAQIQIYSNRAPDYCIFVSGRKILSRNKCTVIGIPITVNLFLDSTAAISQNQSRKEVERSAQKQILTPHPKTAPSCSLLLLPLPSWLHTLPDQAPIHRRGALSFDRSVLPVPVRRSWHSFQLHQLLSLAPVDFLTPPARPPARPPAAAAVRAARRRRRFYIYHKLPIDRPTWRLYW